MSKSKITALTNPNAEVLACATRFKALHGLLKQTVMGTKLLKYFLGLEASRLYELHEELYGETRGRPGNDANNGTRSVIKLEDFLEDHLQVTARSARKYRDFFEGITTGTEHADTVKRLNGFWMGQRESLLALPAGEAKKGAGSSTALSLQSLGSIAEKDLQTILDQPDEWGLHELFEAPLKDAGSDSSEEQDGGGSSNNKHKLAKFWLQDFSRRAMQNEFLKLPKREKEALLTTLEEATSTLKSHLSQKGKK